MFKGEVFENGFKFVKFSCGVVSFVVNNNVVVFLNIFFDVKMVLVKIEGIVFGISMVLMVYYFDMFKVREVFFSFLGIVVSVFFVIWIIMGRLKIVNVSVFLIIV